MMVQWQHTRIQPEVGGGSNPGPYVGKLEVVYRWLAVYSAEPWPTAYTGFLCPQNYLSWYDLYSVESDIPPPPPKNTVVLITVASVFIISLVQKFHPYTQKSASLVIV